jgi:hypothetical protein
MYRKNEILTAKIVPTGGAGRRALWGSFCASAQMHKKPLKCLIFNCLAFVQVFVQTLCKIAILLKTYDNKTKPTHQLLDFQRFANITQTLVFQRFYASLRCGRVGQG